MEETEALLWDGKYKECMDLCKKMLDENSGDSNLWLCLFLAENNNFSSPLEYIEDEVSYKKALELLEDEKKEELENAYTIISGLKSVPLLPHLYLAIRSSNQDVIIKDLREIMNSNLVMDMEFTPEFISSVLLILSENDDKHLLYMMFFYLVCERCKNKLFNKIYIHENEIESVTLETIQDYVSKHDADEKIKASALLMEKYQKKINDLNKELTDKINEFNASRKKMKDEIKGYEKLFNEQKKIIDDISNPADSAENNEEDFSNIKIGSVISFGKYADKDISWRILDINDDKVLVVTDEIIESRNFDKECSNYEKSETRKWLNNFFYDNFTDEEKKQIIKATVDNSLKSTMDNHNAYICNNTSDYVFLLSSEEVQKYFKTSLERKCKGTAYSLRNGLYATLGNSIWWLRSPNYYSNKYVQCISIDGVLRNYSIYDKHIGVRPACYLSLDYIKSMNEKDDIFEQSENDRKSIDEKQIGTVINFGKYAGENISWKVLDVKDGKELILTDKIIDARRFDLNSNNYEISEIRNWLNFSFYSNFTDAEKDLICNASFINHVESSAKTGLSISDKKITDKIFLLSKEEVFKYLNNPKEHICSCTEHALKSGLQMTGALWWLRSPYYHTSNYVETTGSDGCFYVSKIAECYGIRPACWILLK